MPDMAPRLHRASVREGVKGEAARVALRVPRQFLKPRTPLTTSCVKNEDNLLLTGPTLPDMPESRTYLYGSHVREGEEAAQEPLRVPNQF